MAEENLKDFTINWIVIGLLLISMLTFTVTFMLNNNPANGLGDDAEYIFNSTSTQISDKLYETPEDADTLLNISANTNPEGNFLGSRDSVATSFSTTGTAKGFWQSMKVMVGWVFSGTIGQILIAVLSGVIGFLAIYYITKWIRVGA